jgi:hypothetical protein
VRPEFTKRMWAGGEMGVASTGPMGGCVEREHLTRGTSHGSVTGGQVMRTVM